MKTIKIDQHPIYANYIELLKGALLNEFGYENGLRISYLLYCMDTSQPYDLDHVINIQNYQPEKIQALRDDPDSQHNYRERMFGFPYSMIGKARLDSLQMMVETVLREKIPGDFLEAGVWRGGASIFMRAMLELWDDSKRNVYVADSFKGLPPPKLDQDENLNFHLDPTLSVSLDVVKSHFERFGQLNDRVKFMQGWFEDTLSADEPSQLAILRADGDLYKSTMDILDNLYHRVASGGFVIIDDFGAIASCRQAVEDFRVAHQINNPIETIDWTGAYWRV
ncbi:MAG: macrocin O-methyltransferase [Cycloclasticus sp.]|nr:macrocin O-methyltransferase [Cycloclasticus sp.]